MPKNESAFGAESPRSEGKAPTHPLQTMLGEFCKKLSIFSFPTAYIGWRGLEDLLSAACLKSSLRYSAAAIKTVTVKDKTQIAQHIGICQPKFFHFEVVVFAFIVALNLGLCRDAAVQRIREIEITK